MKKILFILSSAVVLLIILSIWKTGILNNFLPFFMTTDGWNNKEREINKQIPDVVSSIPTYYSDGDNTLLVNFDLKNNTVSFTYLTIDQITLPIAISASGARYANNDESIVFWEHQGEAVIINNGMEIFRGIKKNINEGMTEIEARIIAEKNCIKGGDAIGFGSHNEITNTWWFEANLNSTKDGCNPACVVDEETKTAEINWRCTGLNEIKKDSCGIENCHGLDIVCGSNPVEMCTSMYMIGDICRQYANCGLVNGKCQQIEDPQFIKCKNCVEECEENYSLDTNKLFMCESECGN